MRGKILKVVFWSLFLIIGIKVVASLFLLLIHISNLQAKEKSKFEGCPPEFSKVLFIEREKLLKKEMELKAKEEELKEKGLVDFVSDIEKVIEKSEEGIGVIFPAISPLVLKEVAKAGKLMPHKCTYFYPKILTGFVIREVKGKPVK